MASAVKPVPDDYRGLIPYLQVDDGVKAIEFYKTVFGARERMRMPGENGKIMHAELEIAGSVLMLSGMCGPAVSANSPGSQTNFGPISLCLYVPDVDATVQKATAGGANVTTPIENKFYGDRSGTIEDPFGHTWSIMTHIEDVTPEELQKRAQSFAPA